MRPVTKWTHTDTSIVPPVNETYEPYSEAKDDLERNIGSYCSYCERNAQEEAIHIEHIQPKGLTQYVSLEFTWNNFLFACQRCNGTDNKGNKDVVFDNIHLPHLNNTKLSINYLEGGLVQVNPALDTQETAKAQALINLVGLDKRPGHPEYLTKDKRWDRRREVWELAKKYENKYSTDVVDEPTIIDLAIGYGFWSIWFTVFERYPEIRKQLILSFNGTAGICFDETNNYQPIPRTLRSL